MSNRKPVAEILHNGLVATVGRIEVANRICDAHNADCDTYEAKITELTATLDALRDLFGPDKIISNSTCMKAVDILWPKPKETNDENH